MEGEALLAGRWDNIEHLEECLTLEELSLIVRANREKEKRHWKFYGLFKGVNIDAEEEEEAKEAFRRAERRAEQRLAGKEVSDSELDEFADFGIEVG